MGKVKRMDQVKIILQTYAKSGSIKGTARRLQVSKNTVRHYVRLASDAAIDLHQIQELEEIPLQETLYATSTQQSTEREAVFEQKVQDWLRELRRVGVTRHLLWEEYRAEHPDGYGYSQFCELFKRHSCRHDLTIALEHKGLMKDVSDGWRSKKTQGAIKITFFLNSDVNFLRFDIAYFLMKLGINGCPHFGRNYNFHFPRVRIF